MNHRASHNGWTAFIEAARTGNQDNLRMLLSHPDIIVDKPNNLGWTALIEAVRNGHFNAVDMLCAAKANVVKKDGDGFTAKDHCSSVNKPIRLVGLRRGERKRKGERLRGEEQGVVETLLPNPKASGYQA